MHSNNLVKYTNNLTGNLTTFPNKPNLLFCPHKIPKLELLYHLRMWARRDLCIGNHLQQSSSTTLATKFFLKSNFILLFTSRVSYNYCFKVGCYSNPYYFIWLNLISAPNVTREVIRYENFVVIIPVLIK
jgi:hypothetical protein